jgi:hypothetical protein
MFEFQVFVLRPFVLNTKLLSDHLLHAENRRRAGERRFTVVCHGFHWTLPITDAFQATRMKIKSAPGRAVAVG